jgi:transcriptional regulator with XRE-family HTH domain
VVTRTTQHPVFARRLAEARKRAGLSQRQLGVLADLDPTVASPRINQYERGKHEPQLKTAKRLAEVLGIPPAFLYTEDEVLAALLLRWNDLTPRQKKDLLKQAETAPVKRSHKAE